MGMWMGLIISGIVEGYFEKREEETISSFSKNLISLTFTVFIVAIAYMSSNFMEPLSIYSSIIAFLLGHGLLIFIFAWLENKKEREPNNSEKEFVTEDANRFGKLMIEAMVNGSKKMRKNENQVKKEILQREESIKKKENQTDINIKIVSYEQAIENGDSDAMNDLGWLYEIGDGVEKNIDKAIKLYEQAIEHGNADAMTNMAFRYYIGAGVEINIQRTIDLYEQAIKQGNARAMHDLAGLYHECDEVERNIPRAIELYEQAIKHGSKEAIEDIKLIKKD